MMKQFLPYIPPVYSGWFIETSNSHYEQAREAHLQGNYKAGVLGLLDALMPNGDKSAYGDADKLSFRLPHAGFYLDVEQQGEELYLGIDFLRVPEVNRMAVLRRALEVGANHFSLARFVLRDHDRLIIEYRTPMALAHPDKLFPLIVNMTGAAAKNITAFVDELGAERLTPLKAERYSPEEVARMHKDVQEIGRRSLEELKTLMADRQYPLAWLLISTTFFVLLYVLRPEGTLQHQLDKALDDLDEQIPQADRTTRAIATLRSILALSPEELGKQLYRTQRLIDPRTAPTVQSLMEDFEDIGGELRGFLESNRYGHVILVAQHTIYKLYRNCEVRPEIDAHLSDCLRTASDRSAEEQAMILTGGIAMVIRGEIPELKPERKGFWARLKGLFGA